MIVETRSPVLWLTGQCPRIVGKVALHTIRIVRNDLTQGWMIAALRQSAERLKDVPVSGSTAATLGIIQKARAGEMWGYEPTTE